MTRPACHDAQRDSGAWGVMPEPPTAPPPPRPLSLFDAPPQRETETVDVKPRWL